MTKYNKIAMAIAATLFAGSVTAASLDFREEYKAGNDDTAGRIKIGGSTGNHYFGIEMKHSGLLDIDDLHSIANEFEYGYNWDINDKLRFQTAMPITLTDTSTTYKPQVRVQYKFDNNITTKFRWRQEFRNYSDDNSTTDRNGDEQTSLNRTKLTANIDYTLNNFQFGLEGNYAEDFFNSEWKSGNQESGEYEWDYNFKFGYKIPNSAWRPYLELGNVQCNSGCGAGDESGRQLRTRAGITYSF